MAASSVRPSPIPRRGAGPAARIVHGRLPPPPPSPIPRNWCSAQAYGTPAPQALLWRFLCVVIDDRTGV
ncbi:hypothetical protein E2562_011269 [Oryza meyeriana var. granulata]|uniref:Uncharacterized protein n=1 Tax=Oryza meyeriana var. granulata TaxID=110450 RepID=A0A6G1BV50_9ORYZ|nr:hypothetical protein E2562_011269 [Oryza meyeriana var. granulata]